MQQGLQGFSRIAKASIIASTSANRIPSNNRTKKNYGVIMKPSEGKRIATFKEIKRFYGSEFNMSIAQ